MIRLFHVSDLHFGREDKAALAWFKRAVEEERPDAVICTGDVTQRAKREEFAAATAYLESMPCPVTSSLAITTCPISICRAVLPPYRRYGRLES
jgi:3',5'-cyclic AMP phosphodiesterase CpdA